MRHTFTQPRVVSVLVCLLMAAACSKDPCFPGSKGKQYRITIVERWDENSRFPGGTQRGANCPIDFDLKPGSSIGVQVDSFNVEAQGCPCGTGPVVEAPEGWTWNPKGFVTCRGNFFGLEAEVRKGSCGGILLLSIQSSRVPTGDVVPGEAPVAYLQRNFQTDGTTCQPGAGICGDRFVVEIVEM